MSPLNRISSVNPEISVDVPYQGDHVAAVRPAGQTVCAATQRARATQRPVNSACYCLRSQLLGGKKY